MAKTPKYTYVSFANEAIDIANGGRPVDKEQFIAKAIALIEREESRKAYNAEHPKQGKNKGPSEETQALAARIAAILSDEPMTAADITAAINEPDLTPLKIANACKFINNIDNCKVRRETVNNKGLRQEKEYTAYFIV